MQVCLSSKTKVHPAETAQPLERVLQMNKPRPGVRGCRIKQLPQDGWAMLQKSLEVAQPRQMQHVARSKQIAKSTQNLNIQRERRLTT
jgi:hypothetical protein